ncbi:hypothetical protein JKL49_01825 [Phenylobacterium sp. 20VBR1]|uniref:DUF2844 domain-containing protein n=1 Tax=Phenylobacterium glaciei TaxID=2803784 RepID=A0A941D0I3_9CAUL|nr:hypothetical protein [Phenylobacterium glaciei]MBR7618113.1 hypothetical protein [Phenylobacterium glaciei]
MLRIFLTALALTVLLPVPGNAADSTTAANSSEPLNIGFVLYTKTRTPGVLSARWNYANAYSGPGKATGGPKAGSFVGRYHVRYFLENGQFSDEYDLDIQRHAPGDFYDVTWITDGKVSARGVGMEVAGRKSLAVGWRRVAD